MSDICLLLEVGHMKFKVDQFLSRKYFDIWLKTYLKWNVGALIV